MFVAYPIFEPNLSNLVRIHIILGYKDANVFLWYIKMFQIYQCKCSNHILKNLSLYMIFWHLSNVMHLLFFFNIKSYSFWISLNLFGYFGMIWYLKMFVNLWFFGIFKYIFEFYWFLKSFLNLFNFVGIFCILGVCWDSQATEGTSISFILSEENPSFLAIKGNSFWNFLILLACFDVLKSSGNYSEYLKVLSTTYVLFLSSGLAKNV